MGENNNFFVDELGLYYTAKGKPLPEKIGVVLGKRSNDLNPEEKKIYDDLICPARKIIKQALHQRLEGHGTMRSVWEVNYLEHPQTVIGDIVSEVLLETDPSTFVVGTIPKITISRMALNEQHPQAVTKPPLQEHGIQEKAKAPSLEIEQSPLQESEQTKKRALSRQKETQIGFAKRGLRILELIAVTLLLLAVLLTAFLMIAPRFGLQVYTVLSGSMEPALKAGGIVLCKSVPIEEIEVGDIIAFSH
jgi:hypothetical protein